MSARMSGGLLLGAIMMMIVAAAVPVRAEEKSAGEAAGAGQVLREVETPAGGDLRRLRHSQLCGRRQGQHCSLWPYRIGRDLQQ